VESLLTENKLIGVSWAVIDYDDVNARGSTGFWDLSHKHTMFGNASQLVGFRLMPLEPQFRKAIQARFSYQVANMDRRLVVFKDESDGRITSWKWDFGDGSTSTEQNPTHEYKAGRDYTAILEVEGPGGSSRFANVWGVSVK
jgi:PKD repeat protein